MNLSEDLAVEHMKAIRNEVAERRFAGDTEPVKITVVEADWFIEWYDRNRFSDQAKRAQLRVEGTTPPAMPRPYVGMEGTVFGYPCVVVAERSDAANG